MVGANRPSRVIVPQIAQGCSGASMQQRYAPLRVFADLLLDLLDLVEINGFAGGVVGRLDLSRVTGVVGGVAHVASLPIASPPYARSISARRARVGVQELAQTCRIGTREVCQGWPRKAFVRALVSSSWWRRQPWWHLQLPRSERRGPLPPLPRSRCSPTGPTSSRGAMRSSP